jgi:hypothetical protein
VGGVVVPVEQSVDEFAAVGFDDALQVQVADPLLDDLVLDRGRGTMCSGRK